MYPLVPSQSDSESQPTLGGILASIGVVIALGMIGLAGVVAVGYYLPSTSAKA